MSSNQSTQKRCTKCLETKPLEDFAKRATASDGRRAQCKACCATYARMKYAEDPEEARKKKQDQRATNPDREREQRRARHEANPEKFRSQKRAWRATNPDKVSEQNRTYRVKHLESVKATQRAWYVINSEHAKARDRANYANDPEKARKKRRSYYVANPNVFLAARHRRRARLKQNGGSCTAAELNDLKVEQEHKCAYCKRLVPLQVEHIIPVSRGGSSDKSNLCWACRKCNLNKGRKTPDEWDKRWYL